MCNDSGEAVDLTDFIELVKIEGVPQLGIRNFLHFFFSLYDSDAAVR